MFLIIGTGASIWTMVGYVADLDRESQFKVREEAISPVTCAVIQCYIDLIYGVLTLLMSLKASNTLNTHVYLLIAVHGTAFP